MSVTEEGQKGNHNKGKKKGINVDNIEQMVAAEGDIKTQRKIKQEQELAKKAANNLEPAREAEDDEDGASRPKRRHVTPSNLTATVTGDELDRIIG